MMKKRLVALALCLIMVIGLVPTAFAARGDILTLCFDAQNAQNGQESEIFYNSGRVDAPRQGMLSKVTDQPSESITPLKGYHLVGWSLKQGDASAIFNFGTDTYPVVTDNYPMLTFYGIWEKGEASAPTTYTVTYAQRRDLWGATVQREVTVGAMHTVEDLPYGWQTPEGMKFSGVWTDGEKTYRVGTQFQVNGSVLLTPVYEDEPAAKTVTVTYTDAAKAAKQTVTLNTPAYVYIDLNGGSRALLADAGSSVQITSSGWYQISKNSDLNVALKDTWNNTVQSVGWTYNAATKTFTAVWEKPVTNVIVSYRDYDKESWNTKTLCVNASIIVDPNGGTAYLNDTYISKTSTLTVSEDSTLYDAVRPGYTFYGWELSETRGTPVFTARWCKGLCKGSHSVYYYDYDDCKNEYATLRCGTPVVIDPNGGTAKLNGTTFRVKQSFNLYADYTLSDAARTGYVFYGWDLTCSGGTYTFTAMWSKQTENTVPYMLNGVDHYAYIKGYPDGSFKPDATITRAEAASIFYRLLTDSTRKTYSTSYNTFKDVSASAWYNTAVSTMAKLGIVTGGSDGYFRPNDPITRAEIAAMIARCDGNYYASAGSSFSDVQGHWAASYIERAYELGWINGYGATYAPNRNITRAETVAILNRVLNRAPQVTSDLLKNMTTFKDVSVTAWYYLDVQEAANSHTYTRKTNGYEYWNKLITDPSWL